MANLYASDTKLTNVVGRSNYIKDEKRQEEIVFIKSEMLYSWKEHSDFEKQNKKSINENIEARETMVALPNILYKDINKLELFCDEIVKNLYGKNRDYEYAVHWNRARTNLHVHIIYSERENNIDKVPKIYKRDMWVNPKTGRVCKRDTEGAVLRFKKGQIQKDKDGKIRYDSDILKIKDKKYNNKNWLNIRNEKIKKVFEKFGFEIEIQTKDSPFLSQKKLYKGARKDYIDKATEWNRAVKKYNEIVKSHIILDPVQKDNYKAIRKEIESSVRAANSEDKRISNRAIELITEFSNWVKEIVFELKKYISQKAKESNIKENWKQTTNKYIELFRNKNQKKLKEYSLKKQIKKLKGLEKELER